MSLMEKYKGKIAVLVPVFIVLASVGGLVFLSKFKDIKVKKTEIVSPKYVSAISVNYQSSNTTLLAFGKVASAQSINLVAEASGKLVQGNVPLKKASQFAVNDIIFSIDNTDLKLTLQAQKSDFMNLVAGAMSDFKIDFPESFPAWDAYWQQLDVNENLPALPESKSKKEKAFVSNRKLLSMYYSIKSAEEKLAKYKFVAPYSGSIAELKVEAGTVVTAGTPIGRIIRTDEMEAEIPVKADLISWIKKGMSAKLYSQDKAMHWQGTIVRISDFVDPSSQSVNVFVKVLPNKQFSLLEGLYLTAEFKTASLHNVMELPRKALINNDKVFVVENGKLVLKQVNIHKINNETVFFSGLNVGEMVVNESLVNLTEGADVKLK